MSVEIRGLPDYRNLDGAGDAGPAAARMEARAREPASQRMFEALGLPLLASRPRRILELGCGTGALARRVAAALPASEVAACDLSEGMIAVARSLSAEVANVRFSRRDITRELPEGPFDLILSSVTVPYLSDAETGSLVERAAGLLSPGGVLAFLEQDLQTDSVSFPDHELLGRVLAKESRKLKATLGLGLRPLLKTVGLELLPRASFLWTDESFGPYVRDVLEKFADARLEGEERLRWTRELERLAAAGELYYGLVYHRIAGRKPSRE